METADSALLWSVSTPASSGTATVSGTAATPSTFTYAPNADFNGSDSFVVQVTDGASLTDTITVNVTVSGVSDAPVITQGAGPLVVTMSEDGSPTAWSVPTLGATDAETADSSLVWSVSSAATSGTADVSGTAATPSTFTYAPNADFNGSDSFVVQVTDGASLTDTITVNVTVSGVSDAPVITQGAGPLVVTMSEDGSPTAWPVPTLGATDAETADSALVWSVSSAATSGTAIVSGTAAAPTTFTYAPNADFNGSDSFVVQVTDGASFTDTITVSVTVSGVNDVPVFISTAIDSAFADSVYTYNIRANDADGNATLIISASGNPGWANFTYSGSGIATLTGTPSDSDVGSSNISLRATDPNSAFVDQNFTLVVTPSNYFPVIKVDGVDQNSTSVTMWEDNASSFSLTGLTSSDSDDSNGTLAWALESNASNGIATVSGTGTSPSDISYVPNADFNGTDSFVLKVTDARGGFDTLTVDLNVTGVDDPPVITQGAGPLSVTILEDANVTWVATDLNATDADVGDVLTWSVLTSATNGTATASGTGASPTSFHYVPNANFNGSDSFVVQVSDGNSTDTIRFDVEVSSISDSPEISQGAGPLTVTMSEEGSPNPWASPDFNATDGDAVDTLTWSVKTNATGGVASVDGSGVSSSATFTYQPNADFYGNDSFVVQVSDGNSSAVITVNVDVTNVNDAPVIGDLNGTSLAYLEDDGTMILDANATVTDSDGPDFNGSILTVAFVAGKSAAEDLLVILDGDVTVVAMDSANASAYDDGWTDGDNVVGSGLGAWTLADSNDSNPYAGFFIGDSTDGNASVGDINTDNKAFSIYANPAVANANANRNFDSPLALGHTFSITLAATWRNGGKGVDLFGPSGKLWNFHIGNNGGDDYYYKDFNNSGSNVSLGLEYKPDSVFTLLFEQKEGNVLGVTIVRQTSDLGIEVPVFDHDFSFAQTLSSFGLYVHDTSSSSSHNNLYANSIRVTSETAASALVGVSGSNVTFDGTTVGTFTGGGVGQDLAVTFNDKADVSVVTAVLRQIGYRNEDIGNPTPGARALSVTLSDGLGATSVVSDVTLTVTGVNDVPVFTSSAVTQAFAETPYTYQVSANDLDGNSTLSLTNPVRPTWLDFNSTGQSEGVLSGTPTESDIGSYSLSFRALDTNDTYADQNFTIVVWSANYPPIIKVDNIDVSSTPVTMLEDNASSFSLTGLTASDQDDSNATLVWAVDTNASNGTASVEGNGTTPSTVSYAPNSDFNGTDSFVLKVTDEKGGMDTLTVSITVTNLDDPPALANALDNITANEDDANQTVFLTNVFNDVDDDNASITKSATSSAPSLVTVTVNGDILTLDYQADQNGTVTVTVTATSNMKEVNATFAVTVNPVNDAPVIVQGAALTVIMTEDDDVSWLAPELNATDIDSDDSTLTWSLETNATNGTATVTGTGLNPAPITYVPDGNFSGTDSFVVQVTDGNLSDIITVTVTVNGVNDFPVLSLADDINVTMDEGGYPTAWFSPELNATDVDVGDILTWSAFYVIPADGNGTLTVSGTGSSPSVFSYAPNLDFNGTDVFYVRVSDGIETVDKKVTVTVIGNEEGSTVYSLTAPVTYTIDRNASLDFLVTGGVHLASPSPRLALFTDNVYVFDVNSSSGGPLYLGTSPGTPYIGGEVWGNGAGGEDEYLVFRPTSVSPPLLYYYDGDDPNNIFAPIEVRQYQSSDVFAEDPLSRQCFWRGRFRIG